MLSLGIIIALGSTLLIATSDTLIKKLAAKLGSYLTATVPLAVAIIPLLTVAVVIPPVSIAPVYLLFTVLGGLIYALALILILKSLETEQASNTWALSNITLVPIILLGALVLAEPLNTIEIVGILAVIFGSTLITVTGDLKFNKKLFPAIAGNLLYAIYFLLITYSISQAPGAYTMIFPLAYAVALVALLAYGASASRLIPSLRRFGKARILPLTVLVGLLSGLSYVLWLFVVVLKTVALGGAIQVFEPAIVVVFAYFVYKERLTALQMAGIVIALGGALAISLL